MEPHFTTFLSCEDLVPHLEDPTWVVVDCRFTLEKTERGRVDYARRHIPGAVYCHLNDDLCGPIVPGVTGRHPPAPPEKLKEVFSRLGIGPGVQVAAYDDWPVPGGIAARLWWALRWLGHEAAAVLDGGWQRWVELGLPTREGVERWDRREFTPRLRPELFASSLEVDAMRQDPAFRVVDCRAHERYLGQNETIDPVAGHIPGAYSAPYMENVDDDGMILPRAALKERFERLLGSTPPQNTAFYCGSGVTAAFNLLAMQHAGLGEGRLYVGAWSEWITDPHRPVATEER